VAVEPLQPQVEFGKGCGQGLLGRKKHVVTGAVDRDDGGAIAEATRPACDLLDVENGIGEVDARVVRLGELRLLRAQNQRRHSDVEAAVKFRVTRSDGPHPAEGDGAAGQRLPVEVVVPHSVCRNMKAGTVSR
jgi:hypothetical protein